MITESQFKSDLASFLTTYGDLITAIENYLASKPATDWTDQDNALFAAAKQASDEINKLQPPTPVPTPTPPSP